ncbi:hypothetical protein ACFQJ8_05920 [Halocatena marina]
MTQRDDERRSSSTSTLGRVLDGLQGLGVVMLLSGGSKLAGTDQHVQSFEQWGSPRGSESQRERWKSAAE